jgi:hypothetical protein
MAFMVASQGTAVLWSGCGLRWQGLKGALGYDFVYDLFEAT